MSNANIASSKTTDLRATGSILIDEYNPAGDDAQADWAQKGLFMSPTVVAARPDSLVGFYVTVANNYGKLQLTSPSALVAPGATTQVIFNNAGVLAGSADFTFNDTTDVLTVDGTITDGAFSTTAGTVTGVVALTASGAVTAGTLTDGTFSTTAGDVTGVAELTMGAQSTGTATLVAGTVTVASTIVAAGDSIIVTMNTPGGTTGTHYSVADANITPGASFVIEAVDTAGALVNTDTSTINWLIVH